jgi:hypothetical protein
MHGCGDGSLCLSFTSRSVCSAVGGVIVGAVWSVASAAAAAPVAAAVGGGGGGEGRPLVSGLFLDSTGTTQGEQFFRETGKIR